PTAGPGGETTVRAKSMHSSYAHLTSMGGERSRQMLSPAHACQCRPKNCQSRRSAASAKRRPRLSHRWLVLHLSRLSRSAAAKPQVGWVAGQCRTRVLQHAVEAVAEPEYGIDLQ